MKHNGRQLAELKLTSEETKALERLTRRRRASPHQAFRARIVLQCASGLTNSEVARKLRNAEEIAGPKGKHEKERTHNHWGSTNGELSFGGRRIQVSRPRVRSKSGEEASLPHFKAFREEDPLPERVLNQILVGVSTRNYESSLDKPAAKLKSRGTSKSAASRHLVSQTTKKLEQYLSRRLEEYELAALMMDGLEVAGQTVVVTLGITIDGTKVPLGIWLGSTENSQVCTAMLQDLLERGLRIDESILCVVDGGKGIRKALVDVLGDGTCQRL